MAEKEYIERGALVEAWERERAEATDLFDAFDFALEDVPVADVVEVVRCKDCTYWQDNNGGYPHKECRWGKGETPDSNDFCSYGERKEDNR